jgi:hypothetical protein
MGRCWRTVAAIFWAGVVWAAAAVAAVAMANSRVAASLLGRGTVFPSDVESPSRIPLAEGVGSQQEKTPHLKAEMRGTRLSLDHCP